MKFRKMLAIFLCVALAIATLPVISIVSSAEGPSDGMTTGVLIDWSKYSIPNGGGSLSLNGSGKGYTNVKNVDKSVDGWLTMTYNSKGQDAFYFWSFPSYASHAGYRFKVYADAPTTFVYGVRNGKLKTVHIGTTEPEEYYYFETSLQSSTNMMFVQSAGKEWAEESIATVHISDIEWYDPAPTTTTTEPTTTTTTQPTTTTTTTTTT